MDSAIIAVIGVGLVCFLVLYLINTLDKEKHWILQLLLFVFFISLLLLIPKAVIDGQTQCEVVIKNESSFYVYGDNYTDYHWDYDPPNPAVNDVNLFHKYTDYVYTEHCFTRNTTTGESFMGVTYRMYYLMIGYMIVALAVVAMVFLRNAATPRSKKK